MCESLLPLLFVWAGGYHSGDMRTPYVTHIFGANALAKVQGRIGWLTAEVASSIAWPEDDVWVNYDGVEYVLHGARQKGNHFTAPCISTPTDQDHVDEALSQLYRFTSVLGYYKRGYVDITGRTWGTHIIRYSNPSDKFTTLMQGERGASAAITCRSSRTTRCARRLHSCAKGAG